MGNEQKFSNAALYGDFTENPHCEVMDNSGNFCPEKPEKSLKIGESVILLCERCYVSYLNGNWRDRKKI